MVNKPKKNEPPQRKKPNETKYYHTDEEAEHVDRRVRQGKFKNRQDYLRFLIRQDRQRQSC